MTDEVAHDPGFGTVEHDQRAPIRVLQNLRGGGLCLLVSDFAVDDGRVAITRVLEHVLPDVEHRPTGRVNKRAALALEPGQRPDRDAERRQDDHSVGAQALQVLFGVTQEAHPGSAQPAVDLWVVDDLAGQIDRPFREPPARLIRVVHRPVDSVTEPELASEMHAQPVLVPLVVGGPDLLDERAVVVGGQRTGHLLLQREPLAEHRRRHTLGCSRTSRHRILMERSRTRGVSASIDSSSDTW